MFAIATTKNLQQVMDGGLSSDQTKVMADTNEAWKADVVRVRYIYVHVYQSYLNQDRFFHCLGENLALSFVFTDISILP